MCEIQKAQVWRKLRFLTEHLFFLCCIARRKEYISWKMREEKNYKSDAVRLPTETKMQMPRREAEGKRNYGSEGVGNCKFRQ